MGLKKGIAKAVIQMKYVLDTLIDYLDVHP